MDSRKKHVKGSLPSRGAWIEIEVVPVIEIIATEVAPLTGSVDRNGTSCARLCGIYRSLPSRGAWIEIASSAIKKGCVAVAPLTGSVDRNFFCPSEYIILHTGRSPHGERG